MRKLSKYEKETIINWNEAENLASVYTFNASLKRRLAEFSRKYPLLCRLERSTPEGSVTYVLDKARLSIRLIPPYSEERKAAASAYAKEHGFQVMTAEEKIMRKLYIIQKSLFNIWGELCQSQQLFWGKATEMLIDVICAYGCVYGVRRKVVQVAKGKEETEE